MKDTWARFGSDGPQETVGTEPLLRCGSLETALRKAESAVNVALVHNVEEEYPCVEACEDVVGERYEEVG